MQREWLRCFRGLVEEKWSFLPSSPGACLGAGGQGKVSMSAGHLEPVQESTLQTAGALGSRETGCGQPQGERPVIASARQLRRSNCPQYFPSQSHMKWLVGEREGAHMAEVSVKTGPGRQDADHEKGQQPGLGPSVDLDEGQVWSLRERAYRE